MDSDRALDEISWRLLAELQADARATYAELGRRIGLTAPAVAERVHRLEEAGFILGYHAELNFERVGLPILAYIRVATNEARSGQLDQLVRTLPDVFECHRITGGDSYLIKVAVQNVRHLEALIDRLGYYGMPTTSIVLSSPVTHRIVTGQGESEPENAQ